MKVTLEPEKLVWLCVGAASQGEGDADLPYRAYYDQLPARIPLSEEFVDRWATFARATVAQAITRTFADRTFLFPDGDSTRRWGTWHPDFWRRTRLTFTERAVDVVWESIRTPGNDQPACLNDVSPGDALLLSSLFPRCYRHLSQGWLAKRQSPWVVPAWFYLHGSYRTDSRLPWLPLLQNPAAVDLPLRGLILELAAEYAAAVEDGLLRWLEGGSRWGSSSVNGRDSRFLLHFDSAKAVALEALKEDPFGGYLVQRAFERWIDADALAYDDSRYLEGIAAKTGLFTMFDRIRRQLTDVVAVFHERKNG